MNLLRHLECGDVALAALKALVLRQGPVTFTVDDRDAAAANPSRLVGTVKDGGASFTFTLEPAVEGDDEANNLIEFREEAA